ncbi:MAG TPA: hypothetical protein VGH38_22550 [Bryobacteraceae bacterium]
MSSLEKSASIAKCLGGGVHALNSRKRLWFWFYGVTTVWALAIAGPAIAVLLGLLGESAWAERLADNFDPQWVAEVIAGKGAVPFVPLVVSALTVFGISAVAHLFLLGGALQLFCAHEEFSTGAFFAGCGRNFWRFVRLALVSVLFYAVVMLVNSGLASVGRKMWGEGSAETPLMYWNWATTAILLMLLVLVVLIFDYARIRLVATDSRKTFRAAWWSVGFVFANLKRTAGLGVVLWLIAAALLAVYFGVSRVVTQTSLALVLLLFAIRQVMVLAKGWTQLLFYASQSQMYESLVPLPVVVVMPPPEQEPSPEPEPEAAEPIAPIPETVSEPEPLPAETPTPQPEAHVAETALPEQPS